MSILLANKHQECHDINRLMLTLVFFLTFIIIMHNLKLLFYNKYM